MQAPGLTSYNHQTKLERLAKDRHSSLIQTNINYVYEQFYAIDLSYGSTVDLIKVARFVKSERLQYRRRPI